MNEVGIRTVIREVFGGSVPMDVGGGWVRMPCPIARWTHERGADRSPSAGVSIKPAGVSIFHCFTCGNSSPLHGMLSKYAEFSGEDLDDIIRELEEEAYLGPKEMPEWGAKSESEEGDKPLLVLDKAVFLDLYEPAAGHPYLLQRGIDDDTANLLQLFFDPRDAIDGEERILFPVFGINGDLHGFSGRAIRGDAKLKVRDYHGLAKSKCLLGVHLLRPQRADKVLVGEGLFDYARAWACGQPFVSVMHSSVTEAQAELLRETSLPVYDFFDDDAAGKKGGALLGKLLSRYQPVMKTRYPEVFIENPLEEGGGHWLKDPGEMMPEDFEAMIRDCRLF